MVQIWSRNTPEPGGDKAREVHCLGPAQTQNTTVKSTNNLTVVFINLTSLGALGSLVVAGSLP